uniref:Uncharacterized protein n=1 Tax=Tetraselmis chuii TaxID=63592 RepID=A0A7S1X5Q8_9CHLO|mmetsp:Transcript_33846/g.60474  ORF Transcript_33846/g.60474 Transcript_33846/m.60474 type:complete len:155 (+) Transcript_33846:365-829(+)
MVLIQSAASSSSCPSNADTAAGPRRSRVRAAWRRRWTGQRACVRQCGVSPIQRRVAVRARNRRWYEDEETAAQRAAEDQDKDLDRWWESEVDDWSNPSSSASNVFILLLASIVGATTFGIVLKLLLVVLSLFFSAFKYSFVCIILVFFVALLSE